MSIITAIACVIIAGILLSALLLCCCMAGARADDTEKRIRQGIAEGRGRVVQHGPINYKTTGAE